MKAPDKLATLAGRFAALVDTAPDAPAFRFYAADGEAEGYSRLELWRSAAGMARMIEPVAAGRLVQLVMPLGRHLIAAHLGAQMLGCTVSIFTHPSPKLSHEAYRRNLANALGLIHPDVVVTVPAYADDLRQAIGSGPCRTVVVDGEPAADATAPDVWCMRGPDDVAVIQYSSGSTGLQKGVALTNRMILQQIDHYARFIELDPASDRICSWLPLYHDMGLFTAYLMPLVTGTPVSMIDPFRWIQDPLSLLRIVDRERGTLCWLPNFAFNVLAVRGAELAPQTLDLACLRGVSNCSEPVSDRSLEQFVMSLAPQGLRAEAAWVCYAMAENAFAVTGCGQGTAPYRKLVIDSERYSQGDAVAATEAGRAMTLASCGVPVDDCEIRIVDPASRSDLPVGRVGEVAIRSPFLFREYLNNPEATASCRDGAGWYYSGDLGFVHDGHLYLSGRKKDLIIVAGRNFYPQDIERIASSVPGVVPGRVVALGDRDDAMGTERVIVVVESRENDEAIRKSIAGEIRRRIYEELDCPVSDVVVMPHMWLHKTSSGKIARGQNLARYREWRSEQQTQVCPAPRSGDGRKAGVGEVVAWGLGLAFAAYAYLLLYMVGSNSGWNIYAGF